jgi:hypothetical protein
MGDHKPGNSNNIFEDAKPADWAWGVGAFFISTTFVHLAWYWAILCGFTVVSIAVTWRQEAQSKRSAPSTSPMSPQPAPIIAEIVSADGNAQTTAPVSPPNDEVAVPASDVAETGYHATWYDERGNRLSKSPPAAPAEVPATRRTPAYEHPAAQSSAPTTQTAEVTRSQIWTSAGLFVALVVAVFVYSVISPYWATYRLYEALANRDAESLSRVVAFDDLRENLKRRTNGAVPGAAIDTIVTPAFVMDALGKTAPARSDNRSLLIMAFASGRHDGAGHFIIADTVVFCRYWLNWRVCDLSP